MKAYIGVKMLFAEPMTKGEAFFKDTKLVGGSILESEKQEEGYLCDNGKDTCWKSKEEFEQYYFPIEDKTRISQIDVDKFIVKREGVKLGEKTCIVLDTTLTGFDTLGTSAVVDPANYKQEIGEQIARKDIVNAIWGHLGFVLQWAKNGLKYDKFKDYPSQPIGHIILDETDSPFKEYRRKGNSQMRPFIEGEDTTNISISAEDLKLPTLVGGYVARNPKNHADVWYVAKKYFDDNLEPA